MKIQTIKETIITDKEGKELYIGDSFYSTEYSCEYKIEFQNGKIIFKDINQYGDDLSLNEVNELFISKL